nr:polyphosphate kinase 2 family protein [uncultured Lichenicoccus sp.]
MAEHDLKALFQRYRIGKGDGFRLADHDPDSKGGVIFGKQAGEALLALGVERLSELQQLLYADGRWSVLAVFQAMDGGGKDGTIRQVMSGVNPQGVAVHAFKQPGPVELGHDFLWRIHQALPLRGQIGIFNRSHYEEVLVTRLHPELVDGQKIPETLRGDRFWKHRYQDIRAFERYLGRQGTVVLKFFLHISKDEQRQRLLARLDDPGKNWKFSPADIKERALWDGYQDAYEEAIRQTARPKAPWFVVPADHKWFAHLVVVQAMINTLEGLSLRPPTPASEKVLEQSRRALQKDG